MSFVDEVQNIVCEIRRELVSEEEFFRDFYEDPYWDLYDLDDDELIDYR
jgi:hypothetical protein